MEFNDEDKGYDKIIRSLHKLKKVNAPENFEADLLRKINSAESIERKIGFWQEILMPAKLIPTAALAAVLIVLFMIKFNKKPAENPLSAQPRIREDIIVSDGSDTSIDNLIYNQLKQNLAGESSLQYRSKKGGYTAYTGAMIKNGLNFRQANITKSQRKEVSALKRKFETLVKDYREKENLKY